MRRVLTFATFCSLALSGLASAQTRPAIELEGGGGYVFGGGSENPGPSLPTLDAAIVVWPGKRWGLAARVVRGPGEDLHTPVESLDRTFLGSGHLQYWTATLRHRRLLRADLGLEIGAGMLFGGEFASVQMFHNPPRRVAAPDNFFNGLSVEALVTRGLARSLAVKAGLTCDFNVETVNLQPVALGVIRF